MGIRFIFDNWFWLNILLHLKDPSTLELGEIKMVYSPRYCVVKQKNNSKNLTKQKLPKKISLTPHFTRHQLDVKKISPSKVAPDNPGVIPTKAGNLHGVSVNVTGRHIRSLSGWRSVKMSYDSSDSDLIKLLVI